MIPTCELVGRNRIINIAEGCTRILAGVPLIIQGTFQRPLHDGPHPHQGEENCEAQGQAKKPPRRSCDSSDGKQYTHACRPSGLFVLCTRLRKTRILPSNTGEGHRCYPKSNYRCCSFYIVLIHMSGIARSIGKKVRTRMQENPGSNQLHYTTHSGNGSECILPPKSSYV